MWREHLLGLRKIITEIHGERFRFWRAFCRSTASSRMDGRESYGILPHYSEWTNAKTLNSHILSHKCSINVPNASFCALEWWNETTAERLKWQFLMRRTDWEPHFVLWNWRGISWRGEVTKALMTYLNTKHITTILYCGIKSQDNIASGLRPF